MEDSLFRGEQKTEVTLLPANSRIMSLALRQESSRLLHKSKKKKKRLETMACIEKQKGGPNAGEAFGAVSAGGGRMRLSVAFENELFGSHEWCGGFPFIHPPLQLWEGTSVSPEPRQQSVAAARCAHSPAHFKISNPEVKLHSSATSGLSDIYRLHYICCSFYEQKVLLMAKLSEVKCDWL